MKKTRARTEIFHELGASVLHLNETVLALDGALSERGSAVALGG